MLTRFAVLLGVLLAAALAYWLSRDGGDSPPEPLPDEIADEPDVYIEGARITQFELDGTVKYRLNATRIRRFESEALTRMVEPDMWLHGQEGPPWHVTSKRGYIRSRHIPGEGVQEVVFLRDEVELRQNHEDGRFVVVYAPSLYVYPDLQFAETDQDVMIDTNAGRTKAAGMRSNFATGLLQLSSDADQRVHTIVLPNQLK